MKIRKAENLNSPRIAVRRYAVFNFIMADSLGLYPVSTEMANFIQGIYQEDPSKVYTNSYHNNTNTNGEDYTLAKISNYNLYLIIYTISSDGSSSYAAAIIANTQTIYTIYLWRDSSSVYWNSHTGQITLSAHTTVTITLVALG